MSAWRQIFGWDVRPPYQQGQPIIFWTGNWERKGTFVRFDADDPEWAIVGDYTGTPWHVLVANIRPTGPTAGLKLSWEVKPPMRVDLHSVGAGSIVPFYFDFETGTYWIDYPASEVTRAQPSYFRRLRGDYWEYRHPGREQWSYFQSDDTDKLEAAYKNYEYK